MTDAMHVGRSWHGHPLEDECPCPQAACGLVDTRTIAADCPEHALTAVKTFRQGHAAHLCPGPRHREERRP